MDTKTAGNRLRAARTLAGLTRPELAEKLDLPGLGEKTLGAIERGTRDLRPQEVTPLADVLEVPAEFLTASPPTPEPAEALLQRVELLLLQQNALLDRQSLILERIEQAVDRDTTAHEEIRAETEALRLAARRLVVGDLPAAGSDPPPVPPPA